MLGYPTSLHALVPRKLTESEKSSRTSHEHPEAITGTITNQPWWGFPQNGGYPNSWMVYFMENRQKWMITGGTSHGGLDGLNLLIFPCLACHPPPTITQSGCSNQLPCYTKSIKISQGISGFVWKWETPVFDVELSCSPLFVGHMWVCPKTGYPDVYFLS